MKRVALEKVAKIDRTVASEEDCQIMPYVGLEHLEKDAGHFSSSFVPNPESVLATKFRFTSKHVLYGKLRPYLNKVVMPNFAGVCTTEILPILPCEDELDRTFLWAYLLTPGFVSWASLIVSGANLPRLSPRDLAKHEIPLPPLEEQRRIAGILARADRLRQLRRYALQLSEGYLQSVFLQMFGDPVTRESWPLVKVESLAAKGKNKIRTGPFGSDLLHSEFTDDPNGVMVFGIDNAVQNRFDWGKSRYITQEKYAKLKRYTVYPDDVLITIMGTCGRCAVVPKNIPIAINTKHLCCITLEKTKCLPTFLHSSFLLDPIVLNQLGVSERGAIMAGLNSTIIKGLELRLPPLPLQQQYEEIVQKFERLRAQQREAARQADHLFATLLHRAFTPSP